MLNYYFFQRLSFFLVVFSFIILAHTTVFAAPGKTTCGSYRMDLSGESSMMGLTYSEHVILEKIQKSGGADGKWKLVAFDGEDWAKSGKQWPD